MPEYRGVGEIPVSLLSMKTLLIPYQYHINPLRPGNPRTGTTANSEDPDEMSHKVELCLPPSGSGDILFFPGRPSVTNCARSIT